MNFKKIIKVMLIGFMLVSIGYLVFSFVQHNEQNPQGKTEVKSSNSSDASSAWRNKTALKPEAELVCRGNDPDCEKPVQPEHYVIAYYFHGTHRCYTCMTIEQYAREAIESGFPGELKTGRLKFLSVNVEEPVNRHFIQDYQLYTRSLILVEMEAGKQKQWKNLNQIWTYVRDKEAFINYVQSQVREALNG